MVDEIIIPSLKKVLRMVLSSIPMLFIVWMSLRLSMMSNDSEAIRLRVAIKMMRLRMRNTPSRSLWNIL